LSRAVAFFVVAFVDHRSLGDGASLPFVDPSRIGYLGWSAGARTGALVAAAEPRLRGPCAARKPPAKDGRRDAIVPRAALLNIVHAAPRGTTVRWYDAPHALDRAAYRDAFAWLLRKLS
jgi:hypothetical protein